MIIKKIRILLIIGSFLMTGGFLKAQVIDSYGIRAGAGLSNQYWEYKNAMFSKLSGWKDYRTGFIGQVYAEKYLGKYFSLRPALGYIQKGFTDDITLTTEEGEELAVTNNKVVLHDLSLDISGKFMPVQKNIKPYLFLGLRGDFLLDYRSVIIDLQGKEQELNTDLYDDFNTFTLGGLIGIGISFNDLLFLEVVYNPAISRNYDSEGVAIHTRYFSLTLGLGIDHLINKKKK